MNFLTSICFKDYTSSLKVDFQTTYNDIKRKEWTVENFNFHMAVSVMSSCKIEGEKLDIDSYIKHKLNRDDFPPNLLEKPNDLFKAYEFASDNKLNLTSFLKAHSIATAHLLPEAKRGKIRTTNKIIKDSLTQKVQYEAATSDKVKPEFDAFWKEIGILLYKSMSIEKIFYNAAMMHLIMLKIQPFYDGNGRAARLLEKWFLASKLNSKAWFVNSEYFYYQNLKDYYQNLDQLGGNYKDTNYENSTPFLLMLPEALIIEKEK